MPLQPGTRLGAYEIVAPIGAGGMGEVYKASDPRLHRTVAIKVLGAQFSQSSDLKQRLEREAQTLAALNHPHICTLYDVGQYEGADFLVMEYIDGETLAERLKRGALDMGETLKVAIAIADALDKAHRQGITHRDLKPANVMLSASGIKLLDFGLAKLRAGGAGAAGVMTAMPTRAAEDTTPGTILGTMQYMAPEQLEGKEADARTDIFAFGAVLYEMATGQKAFDGKNQATLISAIISAEPRSIAKAQPMAPPALDYVVKRCLAKDPARRVQTAWDLMGQLQWIAEGGSQIGIAAPVAAERRKRSRLVWTMAAAAGLVAIGMAAPAYLYLRGPAIPQEIRFLESRVTLQGAAPFVVSPDGRFIAMTGRDTSNPTTAVFVRPMGSTTAQRLPGTDNPALSYQFWSPDSRSIAFFADGKLKTVDVAGGPPQNICNVANTTGGGPAGGTWNRDGVIIFGSENVLYRVLAAGGEAVAITALDQAQQESRHWWPHFLPDGKHYLYRVASTQASIDGIFVGSLDSKERTRLVAADSKGVYVEPGYLLFHRDAAVFAQPFDAETLVLSGDAIRVADPITVVPNFGSFDASRNGSVLTYRVNPDPRPAGGGAGAPAVPDRPLVWVNRSGEGAEPIGDPGGYLGVDLSPDGKRLAVHRHDGAGGDIWIVDAGQSSAPVQRLTFDAAQDNSSPIWSPDGTRIAFASQRGKKWGLYTKLADGTAAEELVVESDVAAMPMSWSPDGKVLVYQVLATRGSGSARGREGADQWAVPLTGDRKPFPILQTDAVEVTPQISPDGKWIAYSSDETDAFQIYVKPFPNGPGKWQVSTGGGYYPRWRRDGKELYFMTGGIGVNTGTGINAGAGTSMAVDIRVAGSSVQPGVPRALFPTGYQNTAHPSNGIRYHAYAASPDGQRFLIPQLRADRTQGANTLADTIARQADAGGTVAAGGADQNTITVDLNWMSILKRSGGPK